MLRFAKHRNSEPTVTYEAFSLQPEDEAVFDLTDPVPELPPVSLPYMPPLSAPPAHLPVAAACSVVIAAGAEIEGRIRCPGSIRVEGAVRGDIDADTVHLADGGRIEGRVTADFASLHGTLRGAVEAREIEISGGATVEAELTYEDIGIARGARVSGIHRQRQPAPVPVASATPDIATAETDEAETDILGAGAPVPGAAERTTLTATAQAEAALQELAEAASAAAAAASDLANGSCRKLAELEDELRLAGAGLEFRAA